MDNRSVIIINALQLFAARGYDAVGVQEIADRAGITKPTLYYYFGSKKGLLAAILKEYGVRLYEAVKAASVYQGDLSITLERLATAYFQFAGGNGTFYRMQLAMYFAPPESEPNQMVREMNETHHRLLEDLFIQAVNHHRGMKGYHLAYAATFLGTINTYIGFALNGYLKLDQGHVNQAVHQFMHGIYA